MKERFILSSVDCGYHLVESSSKIMGTSCAAPRVAGAAAILKSKFPNLSGADLTDILLGQLIKILMMTE